MKRVMDVKEAKVVCQDRGNWRSFVFANPRWEKDYKTDISLYELSYETSKILLAGVGLRLTRTDSPLATILWSAFYWFEFFNMVFASSLEIGYMIQVGQKRTFEAAVEIFGMIPCAGYVIMSAVKSYNIFVHRPVFENLISELRGMWPCGSLTEEEHDLIVKPIRRVTIINRVIFWSNHLLLALFIIPHVVNLVKKWLGFEVTLKLPFFFWLPFNPHVDYVYEFMLVMQTWQAIVTVYKILCCDTLFSIFMVHITIQFDLLSVRIRKMVYVPTDDQLIAAYPLAKESEERTRKHAGIVHFDGCGNWEQRHLKELGSILRRHRDLIRLSTDVESMFSFELLVNFIYSSIIICFCGFCCIIVEKWNEFIYKTFLITALGQTWLLCWYGQRLLDASQGIADSLYNSGWYLLPKRIRSNVFIMIHRAQKNVRVTTYGFSVISLSSFSNIIKTSWSYFTLLLNTYKK